MQLIKIKQGYDYGCNMENDIKVTLNYYIIVLQCSDDKSTKSTGDNQSFIFNFNNLLVTPQKSIGHAMS